MKKVEFIWAYYNEYHPKLTTAKGEVVKIIAVRPTYITYTTNGRICVANRWGYALTPKQKDRSILMVVDEQAFQSWKNWKRLK